MPSGQKTVLLVDDSGDLLDLFAVLVGMEGCNAITATNGAEAVQQAFLYRPDLILTDIAMPVMDGYEATRQILSVPQMSQVPVVAITAHYGDIWARRALAAGCVECIKKPLLLSELHELIQRYVSSPQK